MLKVIRALLQGRIATPVPEREFEAPPDTDAFCRQQLAMAIGPEAAAELEAELDYQHRVARMERLVELRRREQAARAKLESLR